jgi:5-methylcytosine-specific restriction endonuclease McrA
LHYDRWKKGQSPEVTPPMGRPRRTTFVACAHDGCDDRTVSRGLCRKHYNAWYHADPSRANKAIRRSPSCSVEGCGQPHKARGYCDSHYWKFRQHGDPLYVQETASCSVDGCDAKYYCRSFCSKHYSSWAQYGDPLAASPRFFYDASSMCSEDACVERPIARGLCDSHYQRMWSVKNHDKRRSGDLRRRARRAAVPSEDVRPSVVFERDVWICHLCEGPIDRLVVFPDPMSSSVDHVIPLSRGGHHIYSNCAAAHLVCNLRKGSRILGVSNADCG